MYTTVAAVTVAAIVTGLHLCSVRSWQRLQLPEQKPILVAAIAADMMEVIDEDAHSPVQSVVSEVCEDIKLDTHPRSAVAKTDAPLALQVSTQVKHQHCNETNTYLMPRAW